MKENEKKAFDFAADTAKQLISISSAIITVTIAFSKNIVGGGNEDSIWLLGLAWGAFIFSILFGIFTLMSLTGTLQPIKDDGQSGEYSINGGSVRLYYSCQFGLFILALIFTAIFGYQSLNKKEEINQPVPKEPANKEHFIVRQSVLSVDSSKVYTDTLYLNDFWELMYEMDKKRKKQNAK